jgi:hypothetical protein
VYSDQRLKKDITQFDDGLDTVMRLNPVMYRYNGVEGLSDANLQVGLIAQDVEEVAPLMISTRHGADLDDVRVMSTQALPYMLINAIQELETKVLELEKRLGDRL